MKRRGVISFAWWRSAAFWLIACLATLALLTFHLTSLTPRLSVTEQQNVGGQYNIHALLSNPLSLWFKLAWWAGQRLHTREAALIARLPSVIWALVAVALMIFILRRWYGRRSMVFGLLLVATSAWLLHTGRFAGVDVEYFTGPLALLAVYIGLQDHGKNVIMWFVWLVTHLLLLFIPGMIWLIILSAALQWRTVSAGWQERSMLERAISVMLFVLAAGLLTYAFILQPSLAFTWLGLPTHIPDVMPALRQLLSTVLAIGLQAPDHPELWLGQLPILDVFTLFMFFAGLAFYGRHWRASRTHLLLGCLIIGLALASLGIVGLSIIVPILYLIAVGGIAYVLHFWMRVFPRNPLARVFGIGLVLVLVGATCYYNLEAYFVAWPHNPTTVLAYQRKPQT